jgi:hypothetical protein
MEYKNYHSYRIGFNFTLPLVVLLMLAFFNVSVSAQTCSNPPTATAGSNASVCSGDSYTLGGSIGGGATTATWTSTGSGTFNPSDVFGTAVSYSPSASDITAGSVTLTLTTDDPDGAGPCDAATSSLVLTIQNGTSPLSGTYTIDNTLAASCTNFISLASAVSNLNSRGVAGNVVFNLLPGMTETAPVGGYVLDMCALTSSLKPSVSQTVTFKTTGTHAVITAFTPGTTLTTDGIIKLVGADYITFDGIDLQENSANTTATMQMEWGFALLKCSGNDGSNFNTIINSNITLNKVNTASAAIYSGNHIATSTTGLTYSGTANDPVQVDSSRNGHNTFYGLNIQNVYIGISLNGNSASSTNQSLNDTLNAIGVPGQTANIITNFGGGSSAAYGIIETNQRGISICNNTITGGNGSTSTVTGISMVSGVQGEILNNTISLTSAASASAMTGIIGGFSSSTIPHSVTIKNNIVQNCAFTVSSSGAFTAIDGNASGGNTSATIVISNNQVINNNLSNVTGAFTGITARGTSTTSFSGNYQMRSNTVSNNRFAGTGTAHMMYGAYNTSNAVDSNTITNNTFEGASGTLYCIRIGTSVYTANANTISNNGFTATSGTSTSTVQGIYNLASPTSEVISNNSITQLFIKGSSSGTHTINGILHNTTASATRTVSNNIIDSLAIGTQSPYVAQNGNVTGISSSAGSANIFKNKITRLSVSGGTGTIKGIANPGGSTANIYNNIIQIDLSEHVPTLTGSNAIIGLDISGGTTVGIYYNTIRIAGSGSGTTSGSSGINISSTTPSVDIRNNIIQNLTGAGGTSPGFAVALRRNTSAMTGYGATSDRNIYYAGAPSASHLLYFDGTNSAQTITAFRALVSGRETNSAAESVTFQSTSAGSANLLKLNTSVPTYAEGNATPINTPAITDDFFGTLRNTSTPDIGAHEDNFIIASPVISNLTLTPGVSCAPVSHTVTATVADGSAPVTSVTLNYSYNGVSQPAVAMTNGGSGNIYSGVIPQASAGVNVTWSVTATDGTYSVSSNGTSYTDSPWTGTTITSTATPNPVCSGNPVNLDLTLSKPGVAVAGSGSTTSATYPCPFYSLWSNTHNQYLIPASELIAAGLGAGNITSLGITLTSAGTLDVKDLSVKIGHTTATDMSAFVSPAFTTVYTNASLTPVPGLNTMNFSTPFNWDGVSNLVIEFCHGNSSSTATMSRAAEVDNTSYVSTIHTHRTTSTAGSVTCTDVTSNITTYSIRPKFTFSGNTSAPAISYSWHDGSTVVGTTKNLTVNPTSTTTYTASAYDANGCSITASPLTVNVNPVPAAPSATNSIQCGTGVPSASVSGNGGFFRWYLSATDVTPVQDSPSQTLTSYSISTTTTFYVAEFDGACEGPRTMVVATVSQPDPVTAAASQTTSCPFTDITLSATQTGSSNNYVYSWTASPSANSGIATSVPGNPVTIQATSGGTFIYEVTATDAAAGCVATSTVSVSYNIPPSIETVSANPSIVCAGSTVNLSATSATVIPGTAVLGAGASTSSTYPCPFYSLWSNTHNQYLVPASELVALGLSAGDITSLGINLSSAGTLAVKDLSVKIGHTSATSMTSFVSTTFTTVYTNASLTPVTGVNTLTFSTPFTWDGTSNIVIEICHGNSSSSATMSRTGVVDNTSYISTIHTHKSAATAGSVSCADLTTNLTTYSIRPQFTFNGQIRTDITSSLNWVWNPGNLTGASVTVNPVSTTTYTAQVTDPVTGCTNTSPVTVTVNPLPATPAVTNSTQCGYGIPTASVSGSGGLFSWYLTPTGGVPLSGENGTQLSSYYISTTTTFYVSEFDGTCESERAVLTATVTNPDAVTATGPANSCGTNPISLSVTQTGSVNNYSYAWSASPASGSGISTTEAGQNITINPNSSGTYTYTVVATDATAGCATTSSVIVNVAEPPAISSATGTPSTVCPGSDVVLNALTPTIAGGTVVVGSGATTSATYSNAFYSAWSNSHTQYLVTAAELTAAGMYAGDITSLGITLTNAGTLDMKDFSLKIGHTNATAMTAFLSPAFTTVYTTASLTAVLGLNTMTFSTPFNWDGTSNIVIEICHGNASSTATMSRTASMDNTSYVSTIHVHKSAATAGAAACADLTTNLATYSVRPKFTFGAQVLSTGAGNLTWVWNPGALSGNTVTVNPTTSTVYTVTATDPVSGCTNSSTVSITVLPAPAAPSASSSTQCGFGVPTASVSGSGGLFSWYLTPTGGTAIAGETGSQLVSYTISTTTTFYVAEFDGTCESARVAVVANVIAPDAITAGGPSSACGNETISLTSVQSGTNNNYTYSWSASPEAGSGITGTSGGQNIQVTPTAGGTYTYTVTATDVAAGCATTSAVIVAVTAPPTITSATASSTTVCPGTDVVLNALTPTIAGGTVVVGSGATTSATYSNAFYSAWSNSHTQYLVTAAELTAAGMYAGDITSLGITLTNAGTLDMKDFSLKIGHTNATAMTAFLSPSFTTVYTTASLTAVLGLNTMTFSTPFNWDGTSNIVIEICHGNASSTATMSRTASMDNTSYVSTIHVHKSAATAGAAACSDLTTNLATYSVRPKFTFGAQVLSTGAGNLTWVWNPGSLSGNTVTVNPTTNTNYTVTATDPSTGCTSTASVSISVLPAPPAPTAVGSSQCGVGVPTATVSGTGGLFSWYLTPTGGTAIAGESGTQLTSYSISTTTTFYVAEFDGTCESARVAVVANVIAPDPVVASSPASVCSNTSLNLSSVQNGTNNNYTYSWSASPSAGSGLPTPVSGQNISVTPSAGGTYTYTVTATDAGTNCVTTSDVIVTVDAAPVIASATAVPSTVCPGGSTTLTATTGSAVQGTANIGGTGTGSIGGDNGNPYRSGNGTGNQIRTQMLVRASELTAQGVVAGDLTSLAFTTTSSSTGTVSNFTISLGLTSATALTSTFETTPVTIVFTQSSFTPAGSGLNTHVFQTPFYWDGTSNLIVNTCQTNNITGTATVVTSVPGFTANIHSSGTTTGCTAISGTTVAARPIMQFGAMIGGFGAGTYTWVWNPGSLTGNSVVVSPTVNTTYTVTATDPATGCTSTADVAVTVLTGVTTPVANANPSTICNSQPVSLSVSLPVTGLEYQWQQSASGTTGSWTDIPGANTASFTTASISSNTYFRVYASCGTTSDTSASVQVTVVAPAVTSAPSVSRCGAGPVTMVVTGTGHFDWYATATGGTALFVDQSTVTTNVSATTTYFIQAYEGTCLASGRQPLTVTVSPADPVAVSSSAGSTLCNGASTTLTASSVNANYDYSWSLDGSTVVATGPTYTVSPSATQTYYVFGNDPVNNCGNFTTITVSVNPLPDAPSVTNSNPVICSSGGSSTLTVTNVPTTGGGYVMNTNCTSGFINISSSGATVGTLTDDNEFNFTLPFAFTFNGNTYTSARVGTNGVIALGSSSGDVITTNAVLPATTITAGNIFLAPYWDDLDVQTGATIKTELISGTTFIIQFSNMSHNNFTTGDITFQVQLEQNGTIRYVYNDVIFGDATYDAGLSATIGIQMSTSNAIQYSFNTASLTNGQCISFSTMPPVTYEWTPSAGLNTTSGSEVIASPTSTTTYTVVSTNWFTGCTSSSTVTVSYSPITATITPSGATSFCEGGSVTLDAGSGYTSYSWSDGTTEVSTSQTYIASPSTTTTYTVTVSNGTCSATASEVVTIQALTAPVITASGSTNICQGGSVDLSVGSYASYLWSPGGETTSAITVTTSGTYTVTVSAANGCTATSSQSVTVNANPAAPVITANGDTTLCWDKFTAATVELHADTTGAGAGSSIQWNDGFGSSDQTITISSDNPFDFDPDFGGSNPHVYIATVTNAAGCFASSNPITVSVGVIPQITSISPASGCTGDAVTITGSDFTNAASVSFNGTAASSFTVVNDTTITVTVPSGFTTGPVSVTSLLSSCTGTSSGDFTNTCVTTTTLNVKMFIQGYYTGGGFMEPALFNEGVVTAGGTDVDSVTISLMAATSPYGLIAQFTGVVQTNGMIQCTFAPAIAGSSYYIRVSNPRNLLTTWSAGPVSLSALTTYDFSDDNLKAYQDIFSTSTQQVLVEPGVWAMYNGDVNQDETIDGFDFAAVEVDVNDFAFGYYLTDISNAGPVDGFDFAILEQNAALFLFVALP